MSIAYQAMKFLESKGFGTEGINLFVGFKPDNPNSLIVTYDEPGPNFAESSDLNIDISTIQILVRSISYLTAESIISQIHKKVLGFGGSRLVYDGNDINYIIQDVTPGSIGKDDNGRDEWTAYYNVSYMSENNDYRI
jgi:hypothetical protein